MKFIYILLMILFNLSLFNTKNKNDEIIYATSIRALSELRQLENSFNELLTDYINLLQHKLNLLKAYIISINHKNLETKHARQQYVANALVSFSLVRRSHEEWTKLLHYIKDEARFQAKLLELDQLLDKIPSSEDMLEALKGMNRIERFYDLKASDMAKGLIWGKQFQNQMSSTDCLILADYLYNSTNYNRAAQWYRLALHKLKESKSAETRKLYDEDSEQIRKMFLISRLREGVVDNVQDYLTELSQNPEIPLIHIKPKSPPTVMELGCRGLLIPRSKKNLFCRYNFTTTPFLQLAPLKMEEISRDPLMWLYHDVIYDSEISILTNATRADMIEAFTDNFTTPNSTHRIMQVNVIEAKGNILFQTLIKRLKDLTGLDMNGATEMAAGNYGLGSYFQEHTDYRDIKRSPELNETGDRLATFVFYLTDVPLGGATIFPLANLTIQPRKGTALFWYNLHNDGQPNLLTQHGVCPTIEGNRWMLTNSFMEWDQMFRKPCYK